MNILIRLLPVAVVLALIALLEWAVQTGAVSRHVIPTPSRILMKLGEILQDGSVWAPLVQTGRIFIIALLVSTVLGFVLGLFLHHAHRIRVAVAPVLTSYFAVPVFIFYPVFVVLFGLGDAALITVSAIFGVMAFISATLNALARLPRVYLRTARIMGLSAMQTLTKVSLPAMLPHLMAGLKIVVTYAMIGVIGAEFILATEGLGYRIAFAYNNFETERMYALMTLIIVFAVVINGSLQTAERHLRKRYK